MMKNFIEKKKIISLWMLITSLFLTSCGFHLRGNLPHPLDLPNLYLQVTDPYSLLTRSLQSSLKAAGIHLVSSPSEAENVLIILQENPSQQLLSVGSTQQTRQYNLILSVTFQINDAQGKVLVPPQILSETRTLTLQSNKILGTSNEQYDLYQQMRAAIVYDIMNRLSSKDIRNLLLSNKVSLSHPT